MTAASSHGEAAEERDAERGAPDRSATEPRAGRADHGEQHERDDGDGHDPGAARCRGRHDECRDRAGEEPAGRHRGRLHRSGRAAGVVDPELVAYVGGEGVGLGELDRRPAGRADGRDLVAGRSGSAPRARRPGSRASSCVSRSMSASSVSRCDDTDVYSPAAIDIEPATTDADAGDDECGAVAAGRGDPDEQAGGRRDAVLGAEDRRPQPSDPAGLVDLSVAPCGHRTSMAGRWSAVRV